MMDRIKDVDVEKEVTFQAAIFLRPIDFEDYSFFVLQHWEVGKNIFFLLAFGLIQKQTKIKDPSKVIFAVAKLRSLFTAACFFRGFVLFGKFSLSQDKLHTLHFLDSSRYPRTQFRSARRYHW
jgi:hypothetical protein